MPYKTILLSAGTYNKVSSAKRRLSKKLGQKLSFGDLFDETFGKNIEFLDMDDALRNYIKRFCLMLEMKDYILGALLFGSVARGGDYNEYSDIDVLVVVSDGTQAVKAIDYVHEIESGMREGERQLASRKLPAFISPMVVNEKELRNLKPIYFDFLDYGVVLFEKNSAITNFLNEVRGIKHRREFRPYEVLTWQT